MTNLERLQARRAQIPDDKVDAFKDYFVGAVVEALTPEELDKAIELAIHLTKNEYNSIGLRWEL